MIGLARDGTGDLSYERELSDATGDVENLLFHSS